MYCIPDHSKLERIISTIVKCYSFGVFVSARLKQCQLIDCCLELNSRLFAYKRLLKVISMIVSFGSSRSWRSYADGGKKLVSQTVIQSSQPAGAKFQRKSLKCIACLCCFSTKCNTPHLNKVTFPQTWKHRCFAVSGKLSKFICSRLWQMKAKTKCHILLSPEIMSCALATTTTTIAHLMLNIIASRTFP